jgi:uncharacterized membrane protein
VLIDHLHSASTVFPAALLVLSLLLEAFRIFTASERLAFVVRLLVSVATVGVVFSFLSGYIAAERADRYFLVPNEAIVAHHDAGRVLLILTLLTCGFWWIADYARHGGAWFRGIARVLLFLSMITCAYSAFLGGELVQRYGAGVHAEGATVRGKTVGNSTAGDSVRESEEE